MYANQGAGHGYTHFKKLNALIGTFATLNSAPMIADTGCKKEKPPSVADAASFVAATLATASRFGTGRWQPDGEAPVIALMDSAFYTADVIAARRICDAEVADNCYTAFTRSSQSVTVRLHVRRVKLLSLGGPSRPPLVPSGAPARGSPA